MTGRGLPIKNIIYAVAAVFSIYMLYIYHGAQNRLQEAEMTGARFKREVEERVTEIQDLVKNHDKFQETCQKEKKELKNTIASQNTMYQMLESHQKDTEADLNTIKQHMETMKKEHEDAFNQHAQEYQSLKQDKDNEIAKIKDELADAKRRNADLENTITNLRQQIQADQDEVESYKSRVQSMERDVLLLQSGRNQLLQENSRLQQSLNANKVPGAVAAPNPGAQVGGLQDHQQPHLTDLKMPDFNSWIAKDNNKDVGGRNIGNIVMRMKADSQENKFGGIKQNMPGLPNDKNIHVEPDNSLNQVQPPKMNSDQDLIGKYRSDEGNADGGVGKNEINPNDEQKAQILQPILPNKDEDRFMKNDNMEEEDRENGGGEIGAGDRNARDEEEEREAGALKEEEMEEDELEEDKPARPGNPLSLHQLEPPGNPGGRMEGKGLAREVEEDEEEARDRGGPGVGAGIGQQLPPNLNREDSENKFGENQYFEEERDHQMGEEEEEEEMNNEELEEEEEEGVDNGEEDKPEEDEGGDNENDMDNQDIEEEEDQVDPQEEEEDVVDEEEEEGQEDDGQSYN